MAFTKLGLGSVLWRIHYDASIWPRWSWGGTVAAAVLTKTPLQTITIRKVLQGDRIIIIDLWIKLERGIDMLNLEYGNG